MNILIFNNCEPLYSVYKNSDLEHVSSIDHLNGVFLTNLSQFDSICKSTVHCRLLPHNYFGLDVFDLVRNLTKNSKGNEYDLSLKYITKASSFVLENFNGIDVFEGRSLPYVYSDFLSCNLPVSSLFSAPLIPLLQKNYFLEKNNLQDRRIKTFRMTNVEIFHVLRDSVLIDVEYEPQRKVDIPILIVGNKINEYYLNLSDYYVTVSFKEPIPHLWMFFLGIFSFDSVVLHSSIFKLVLKHLNAAAIQVNGLAISKAVKGKKEISRRLLPVNSIASWFTTQIVNTVIIHAVHYCSNPMAVSIVSRLRAEMINKAIEINNLGIAISSFGSSEISIVVSGNDIKSVRPRLKELLLYES
ncbi:hypothetical protein OCF84_20765 (plasmid) [Shewanella xiamenensis]|uniref:Uncharacterized protein n=1 Tax=Shewanella xiamenensis TaxID=332186 RepID=A0ABT6UFP9_9GAMM|nr:hypothetical protein [Shewanella xiamenensis]MDI5833299.1 hypothetical protein [Shewanella xiamenensis]WHF57951.1 hypothetical protein OCF84_20765 [Shewanella xiamenensis]